MENIIIKTAICSMACDGTIAQEEIDILDNSELLKAYDKEALLRELKSFQEQGKSYIKSYVRELSETSIKKEEAFKILNVASEMIRSDNEIHYLEIKFFKLIINALGLEGDDILEHVSGIDEDWVEEDLLTKEEAFKEYFRSLSSESFRNINLPIDLESDSNI